MSKVILYSQEVSPPCRTVLMVAHAIGLKLEIREINLLAKEQLSAEFKKINPHQTIPVLEDDGFVLPDSHAIICYLADKYAKDDTLYPKDLQKRALVNHFLYFDTEVLFPSAKAAFKPIIFQQLKSVPEDKMKVWQTAYAQFNDFLDGKKWLVGDSYTLADINCVTTVSSSTAVLNMDDYPNVKAWLERCERELPGYEECNVPGLNQLITMIRSKMS